MIVVGMKYSEIKGIAGRLWKNQTASEKKLWEILRRKQILGYKFLRQHPLYYDHNHDNHRFFIPDFYCSEIRLIIELDGAVHINQKEHDAFRDEILQSRDFKILRINNEELEDIKAVKNKIENYIEKECNIPN